MVFAWTRLIGSIPEDILQVLSSWETKDFQDMPLPKLEEWWDEYPHQMMSIKVLMTSYVAKLKEPCHEVKVEAQKKIFEIENKLRESEAENSEISETKWCTGCMRHVPVYFEGDKGSCCFKAHPGDYKTNGKETNLCDETLIEPFLSNYNI